MEVIENKGHDELEHDPEEARHGDDRAESQQDHERKGESGASFDLRIGSNTSGQTNFANTFNQFFASPADIVAFSPAMAVTLDDDAEVELLALVTIDEEHSAALVERLEQQRVLVITGEHGTGKGTIAKYLATRLAKKKSLRCSTYTVGSLQPRVRIVLRDVAADREKFGERVTLFLNAFEHKNKDLRGFFTSDASEWETLRGSLVSNGSYLIFTTSHVDFDAIRAKVSDRVACVELPAPPAALVAEALDRKVAWLEARAEILAERLATIRDNRDRLIATLESIPRVIAAVDEYLRGDGDFEATLERHAHRSASLLHELERDVDAWCFALTLALAQATTSEPIAWADFEHLRRLLTDRIKRDPEMFPPRRHLPDGYTEEPPDRTTAASLSDDALIERCRARIEKDAFGLRDAVSFRQRECAERIWAALLQSHRRVLTAVVPVLQTLAEKERAGTSISLRLLAAETIGRIGTIDPRSLVLPLIERRWIGRSLPLVGCVMRGALAGDNARYHEVALAALESLTIAEPEKLDDATRERLMTAIGAYAQIGDSTVARTMEHLGDIAIQFCAPHLKEIYELLVEAEKVARGQRLVSSKRRAAALRAYRRALGDKAERKLTRQEPILVALEEALVYLCVMKDDVQTLKATRDWMSRGGEDAGIVVSLLFLHPDGIADRLEEYAAEIETPAGTVTINPLILSAASSRDSMRDLCGFLCDVYVTVEKKYSLPVALQRELQQRFAACLIAWARGAALSPTFREVIEELFGTLAAARGGVMRRSLYGLMGAPDFAENEPMRALAKSVRLRMDA